MPICYTKLQIAQRIISDAVDISDNCVFDCSNVSSNPKYIYRGNNRGTKQHLEARMKGSLYLKKTIPALEKMYKAKKINGSRIKSDAVNYSN